jgi:hypothetical protein
MAERGRSTQSRIADEEDEVSDDEAEKAGKRTRVQRKVLHCIDHLDRVDRESSQRV